MKDNILDPEKTEYHASVAEGLAEFLEKEIKSFSLIVISKNRGGVFFKGKKENLKNFLLNTRFASKVSIEIASFKSYDPEELYEKSILIPWEKYLEPSSTFKIESLTKDHLNNSRFALYKLKDAILDRYRKKIGDTPEIEKNDPDYLILLRSHKEMVSISISLTSSSITKRGYRSKGGIAPLRENIAQTVLEFSGWDKKNIIIDPMCGSGTILIEAALLLQNIPLNFQQMNSSVIFKKLFGEIKKPNNLKPEKYILFGFDKDPIAIQNAKINAKNAEVDEWIIFENKNFSDIDDNFESGLIITNPPYGERLEDKESAKILYGNLSNFIKEKFKGFNFTVIVGDKSLLGFFRLKEDKSMSLTIANWKAKIVNYKIK